MYTQVNIYEFELEQIRFFKSQFHELINSFTSPKGKSDWLKMASTSHVRSSHDNDRDEYLMFLGSINIQLFNISFCSFFSFIMTTLWTNYDILAWSEKTNKPKFDCENIDVQKNIKEPGNYWPRQKKKRMVVLTRSVLEYCKCHFYTCRYNDFAVFHLRVEEIRDAVIS